MYVPPPRQCNKSDVLARPRSSLVAYYLCYRGVGSWQNRPKPYSALAWQTTEMSTSVVRVSMFRNRKPRLSDCPFSAGCFLTSDYSWPWAYCAKVGFSLAVGGGLDKP